MNIPRHMELLYDKPLSGEKDIMDRGTMKKIAWVQYSFKDMEDGQEYVKFFNPDTKVCQELLKYGRGDQLKITYKQTLDRATNKTFTFYEVEKVGENPQAKENIPQPKSEPYETIKEQPRQDTVIDLDNFPF